MVEVVEAPGPLLSYKIDAYFLPGIPVDCVPSRTENLAGLWAL